MSLDEMILETVTKAVSTAVSAAIETTQRTVDLPENLTTDDLAKHMQISRPHALNLCRVPGFPMYYLGRAIRIPRADLLAWQSVQAAEQKRIELATMTAENAKWLSNLTKPEASE
jgi:excisionase family DNA binding protein